MQREDRRVARIGYARVGISCLFYKVVVMWKSGFGEMLEPGEIFLSMMVLTLAWPPKTGTGYPRRTVCAWGISYD